MTLYKIYFIILTWNTTQDIHMKRGGCLMTDIKRGDIYYADLSPAVGSEQGGIRPVLILQNDKGNKYSPTTIVVAMTSKTSKKGSLPTHISLNKERTTGLPLDSMVLCEQLRTIDKKRIKNKIGKVNDDSLNYVMKEIKEACDISLGF